ERASARRQIVWTNAWSRTQKTSNAQRSTLNIQFRTESIENRQSKIENGEAGSGIEPANSGFADRSLTTWLPRHQRKWRVTRDLTVSMSRDIRREKAGECTGERCTNSRTTSRELLWWFYDGLSWFRVIADHPEVTVMR